MLIVTIGKTDFFKITISTKSSFGQLKSTSDSGFERNYAKGRKIISKCPKTIEKPEFFKHKLSSNCSHEDVVCVCDTWPIFFSVGKNSFFYCTKAMEKKIFFQTNFSLRPYFWTCRLPSWDPVEIFFRTLETSRSLSESDEKLFPKKINFTSKSIWTRRMQLWQARQNKLTQYSNMIEKILLFPEKKDYSSKISCGHVEWSLKTPPKIFDKRPNIFAPCPRVTKKL